MDLSNDDPNNNSGQEASDAPEGLPSRLAEVARIDVTPDSSVARMARIDVSGSREAELFAPTPSGFADAFRDVSAAARNLSERERSFADVFRLLFPSWRDDEPLAAFAARCESAIASGSTRAIQSVLDGPDEAAPEREAMLARLRLFMVARQAKIGGFKKSAGAWWRGVRANLLASESAWMEAVHDLEDHDRNQETAARAAGLARTLESERASEIARQRAELAERSQSVAAAKARGNGRAT